MKMEKYMTKSNWKKALIYFFFLVEKKNVHLILAFKQKKNLKEMFPYNSESLVSRVYFFIEKSFNFCGALFLF